METPDNLVAIGIIRKPVGLDGWCGVTPFGHTLEMLKTPCGLSVGLNESAVRSITVLNIKKDPKGFRLRFEGVGDRDSADTLRENTLFVLQDRLPRPGKDRLYHFELEKMVVVRSDDGQEVGVVVAVHNYPSIDALDVRLNDGRITVIPMTADAVLSIDRQARRIVISPLECEDLL